MKKKSERERASEKKEWSRMEREGERELCPKQAAIKRALKKGQKKKREGSAYTTDKANKVAEGVR